MKKAVWVTLGSLVFVLLMSFIGSKFLLPMLKFGTTYSETNCITDQVTQEMTRAEIAKLYRDNNSTVAVMVKGQSIERGLEITSLGSGAVIASKGYETTTLPTTYTASKGSYIVTNHHVIEMLNEPDFYTNCAVAIKVENEKTYPCELIWSNKDLDVAILYCDTCNMDYIRMADRSINCSIDQRLDITDKIFTIGTPLNISYLNRYTEGNIASNNPMVMATALNIYPYMDQGTLKYRKYLRNGSGYTVLDNVYEDTIDISLGMTAGNSGGGCYDSKGLLVGLTTLGSSADRTGGNQMNGAVSIYPVIEVLDRIIANNEKYSSNVVLDIEKLGLKGFDETEAKFISTMNDEYGNYNCFYLDGQLYDSTYTQDFSFKGNGYYVISNNNSYSALSPISRGCVITSYQIDDGVVKAVENRNDLLYGLLQVNNKEKLTLNYNNTYNFSKSVSIQF